MGHVCWVPIDPDEDTPCACLMTGTTEGAAWVDFKAKASYLAVAWLGVQGVHETMWVRLPFTPAAARRVKRFRFVRGLYDWSSLVLPGLAFVGWHLVPGYQRAIWSTTLHKAGLDPLWLIVLFPVAWMLGFALFEVVLRPRFEPLVHAIGAGRIKLEVPSAEAAAAFDSAAWQPQPPRSEHSAAGAGPEQVAARREATLSPLIASLEDSDLGVRMDASYALSQLGPVAVPALIEVVRSGSSEAAERAMEALGGLGAEASPAHAPILERLLHDDRLDPLMGGHALKEIDAEAAYQALVEVLEGEGRDERTGALTPRERAANALGFNEPARAVPHLARAIERFGQEHDELTTTLAVTQDPEALPGLLALVEHASPLVRKAVRDALSENYRGQPGVADALARLGPA